MQSSEMIHPEKNSNHKGGEMISVSIGEINTFEQMEHSGVILHGEYGSVVLTFINPHVFRFTAFFDHDINLQTTTAVQNSPAKDVKINITEDEDSIRIHTEFIETKVTKKPFSLAVYNREGNIICEQPDIKQHQSGAITCTQTMGPSSHFYGFGEKTGFLDKRGERYTMWNSDVYDPHVPDMEALYVSIPFLIHFKEKEPSYGIFLDNPGKTVFDMRSGEESFYFQTETGVLDYYFIYGPELKEIIYRYTDLTGRMPLPPKWALGYHQSRYSYMNEEEVLDIARTFREKKIPCDAIYLDIHYMEGYRVFTFDRARFPNPKKMIRELNQKGFKVVPIVDPGVKKDPEYSVYREGIENGYFCKKLEGDLFLGEVWPGESAFPDFTEKDVADWWGEKHRYYTKMGIEGIWNDMNEPAVFNESKTMDGDVVHTNNGNPKTHRALHNLYGFLMSKATYEGLEKQLKGHRPFVLTRAGYSGIQRYAAIWTGDNRSYWEHMAMSIPMTLNLGLSGVAFNGPDIGGFEHHASGGLFVRWLQMGVFFPYCRNHSAINTRRQEPWQFGEEVENISRKYIELRYRWMPYLYSLFYQTTQTGVPVIRPLLLEYPQDPRVYNLCDQFLVGSHILVAPIYRPDTEYRSVYLPEGVWYDYWTGQRYQGEGHILVHAPLEKLPLFIKAGAIIAEEPVRQYAEENIEPILKIEVYGGAKGNSSFKLYQDDGISTEYQKGIHNIIRLDLDEKENEITFSYLFEHQGYKETDSALLITFKHLPFIPQHISGVNQVNLTQLHDVTEGWAFDENTNDIVMKLKPVHDGRTFFMK